MVSWNLAYYKRKIKNKWENTAQMQFWYMKMYEYYYFNIAKEYGFMTKLHF